MNGGKHLFPSYLTRIRYRLSLGNEAGQVVLMIGETIVFNLAYIKKVTEARGLPVSFAIPLKGRRESLLARLAQGQMR